jgi:microcystin-dependent protein
MRAFGFNFAPEGWFQCNGQLLSVQQYAALFSVLGTCYGGNGTTNFGLPNLREMVPIGQGTGPALSSFVLGETAGEQTHTLLQTEMPSHSHALTALAGAAAVAIPVAGSSLAEGHGGSRGSDYQVYTYSTHAQGTNLNPNAVGTAGNSQPHPNMQPSLTVNWCIARQGIYPSRP